MSDLVRGIVRETPATDKEPAVSKRGGAAAPPSPMPATPAPPRGPVAPTVPPPSGVASPTREVAPPPSVEAPTAPTPSVAPAEDAGALFGELRRFLGQVRELVVRRGGTFPWGDLEQLIQRVVISLERSGELFWVANTPAAQPDSDYVGFHQARVAVLAVRIGANLGHDRRRLTQLGMAGSLIDVGLWLLPDDVRARPEDHQAQYRSHPGLGAEKIRDWSPPYEGIVEAVLQHHEREQGQGFPQGLDGAAIHPHARILGLVDTYAGLTVPPSSEARLMPHEAIREIVRSKREAFVPALIKALLSELSVFPPGTLVRLNTGEVGHVTAANRNHPLRPRLEVVADGKGRRLPVPKTIDLSEAPFLYITGPVSEGAR